MKVEIDSSWNKILKSEFEKEYFLKLIEFVKTEYKTGTIYPPGPLIFNAFNLTPFDKVKVVILGQDPYHGPNQAHGLAFSVTSKVVKPPSLKNIYKELHSDLNIEIPETGDLSRWAKQGVFLLNSVLTVRKSSPGSHSKKGWEQFTDSVIQSLSDNRENLVFLLWGNYAKAKKTIIDESKHLILEAPHPSPFSADSGFFGCRHFSKANDYLDENNISTINW
ncbi:uracil-DNA glycosylase [Candidatus Dojkabacteria bacterium]|uniref:Uracil-DNA glycosylase n=1 Tax=Candidatus Dojkabacteria bacterium TaxID=2099670 RepID=A0A955L0T2_9BACT|nr:uracil-DNA glycosylase [Candidatus Dojkabacteria bacterium]